MSGLSVADMRRIGAERNESGKFKAAASGSVGEKFSLKKAPKLPFLKRSTDREGQTASTAKAPLLSASQRPVRAKASGGTSSPTPMEPTVPVAPLEAVSLADAKDLLRRSALRHAGLGGALVGLASFATTGSFLAAPLGLAVGGAVGLSVARRAAKPNLPYGKAVVLSRKQAPDLYERLDTAKALLPGNPVKLTVLVNGTACVSVTVVKATKHGAPKSVSVNLGLAALQTLSLDQIEALAAHALVLAGAAHQLGLLDPLTVAQTRSLTQSIQKRSRLLQLELRSSAQHIDDNSQFAMAAAWNGPLRESDDVVARFAGPGRLVDALLAQGLVAALLADGLDKAVDLTSSYEALKGTPSQANLDEALRRLASLNSATGEAVLIGQPLHLLDRVRRLDTSCRPPQLPANEPALFCLAKGQAERLNKAFGQAPKTSTKTRKINALAGTRETTESGNARRSEKKANRTEKSSAKGLFGRFLPVKSEPKTPLDGLIHAREPLYEADALFQSDHNVGLEAYQTLVTERPRWMLARLRLAEAQIEMGIQESVTNFMMCAEHLPSALPTVLDRLQSALAMVSPLEEEPLRAAVDQLRANAPAIARERSEIDLEHLSQANLDAVDQAALVALFEQWPEVREAWVLAAPCAMMPEVPHHAVVALAPRLSADSAQSLALSLAEHAAITGTVAVHVETGKPVDALGDVLASHPSYWRAGVE